LTKSYPYSDIAKNASVADGFYPSNVDLFKILDSLETDPQIVTEFEFHSKLSNLISSLNDAHVRYTPKCFSTVVALQPWVISVWYPPSSSDSNVTMDSSIYIRDTLTNASPWFGPQDDEEASGVKDAINLQWTNAMGGFHPATYVGHEIVKINGEDAKV
jgi:hypothetical protein